MENQKSRLYKINNKQNIIICKQLYFSAPLNLQQQGCISLAFKVFALLKQKFND